MSDPKFCGKCGFSLPKNVKFCTNCGTKISDLQEDEKESIAKTTKQDFLTKYYGKKILEYIDEINNNGIGNQERLYSIYKVLENKKELTDEELEYLIECSDEFNSKVSRKTRVKPAQQRYSSSYAFGFSSSLVKKVAMVIGGIFGIFIGIGIIAVSFDDSNDSQSNIISTQELEKNAIEFVQNYKGKDGRGDRLIDVLGVIINVAYPDEEIVNNPSSEIGWYAFEDFTKDDGVYQVGFIFKTYRDDSEIVWYLDTKTNEVFAGDKVAKSVLDTLDTFD